MLTAVVIWSLMLAGPVVYLIWDHWPRSPEALYQHQLRKLMDDMDQRGLSVREQQMELRFRYAMAELTRRASEAAIHDPANHRKAINTISKEIADRMMMLDRQTATGFLRVVTTASIANILTPEAMDAVVDDAREFARSLPKLSITADDIAAVTNR